MTDQTCKEYWSSHPVTRHYTGKGDPVVLPIVDRVKPKTILEIGCGAGRNLNLLSAERPGLKLCGYDFNPTMIAKGKELFPHLYLATHIVSWWRPFDLVFTLSVVDHVEDPEEFIRFILMQGRVAAFIEPWVGKVCELGEEFNVEDLYSFSYDYDTIFKAMGVKVIHRERTPLKGGEGGLSGHYHTWIVEDNHE